MHPMISIALRAARDAAGVVALSSDRLDRVQIINDTPDGFLTSMDQISEKSILYHLEKAYPTHSFHSRVSGLRQGTDKETIWLIDPLVGNRNFASGYTQFAVSIACQVSGVLKHAVMINPLANEEYVATRGDGAQLNSRRIRVSSKIEFGDALISLNPENITQATAVALQALLLERGSHIRISGCTALDLLHVAANRVQGGWAANTNPLSLAAASLILQEAGGLIGSETGNPDPASGRELMFANPRFFKALLKTRHEIDTDKNEQQ